MMPSSRLCTLISGGSLESDSVFGIHSGADSDAGIDTNSGVDFESGINPGIRISSGIGNDLGNRGNR